MAGAISSHDIVSDKMMHVLPCGNSFALWHLIRSPGIMLVYFLL